MKEDSVSYFRVLLFMISFIPTFFYICTIILFFIHHMPLSTYYALFGLAICSILASFFLGRYKHRWIGIMSVLAMIVIYFLCIIEPYNTLFSETYIIGIALIIFYILYDYLLRITLTVNYHVQSRR